MFLLLESAVNGLWQGTVLTAIVAVLLRLSARDNAATRHAVLFALLVTVALLPGLRLVIADGPGQPSLRGVLAQKEAPVEAKVVAGESDEDPDGASSLHPANAGGPIPVPPDVAAALLITWASLSGWLLLRLVVSLWKLRSIVKRAVPIADEALPDSLLLSRSRAPVLLVSPDVAVPVVVGLCWRAILLPEAMLAELRPAELRQVLEHELAHLERRDDWTHLFYRLISAIWFFHPAVLWLRSRLALERELACDEWVLARTGARRDDYARLLVRLMESAVVGSPRLEGGAAISMASKMRLRVEAMMLSSRQPAPSVSKQRLTLVTIGLSLLAWLLLQTPTVAFDRPVPAQIDVMESGIQSQDATLTLLIENLRSPDPTERAQAAYRIGQSRADAMPALPHLLVMLEDNAPVSRERGRTEGRWGRPSEDPRFTSPGEEALKAILYLGRPALESLETTLRARQVPPDHEAWWALELLRDFD